MIGDGRCRGLTLVELLVALVVITVGIGMLLRAITQEFRASARLAEAVQARYDAEAARALRLAGVGRSAS